MITVPSGPARRCPMTDATLLWSIWQALLQSFAWAFTRPGHRRFAEWVTALALNVEEHTITQSVLAIERPADWKALESFAEYGAWQRRPRHPQPDPPDRDRPPAGSGTATTSRPSTTPRSIAAARTSGAPAPSTSTPPAAPTGPPPSGPTTGSPSGPCCENPGQARLVPAPLRAALLPQVAVARRGPGRRAAASRSAPSASWPSSCSGSRPGSPAGRTWPSSTAASPCGAWSGRWSCPRTARPASSS